MRPLGDLAGADVDVVVLATFDPPAPHLATLRALGVPPERVVTLRRPAPAAAP